MVKMYPHPLPWHAYGILNSKGRPPEFHNMLMPTTEGLRGVGTVGTCGRGELTKYSGTTLTLLRSAA